MDPVYLAGNGYIVTVLGRLHTGCFTDRWSCSQRFSFFTRQEKQRVEGCGHRTMANYREKQRQVINLNIFTRHPEDRKSTRLNSSHVKISYAVFCLKKKKIS